MSLGKLVDQLARLVANPGSNLTGSVLLLAMGVLVLLILAVGALITVLPGPDDDEREDADAEEREDTAEEAPESRRPVEREDRPPLPRWVSLGVPAALVLAAVVTAWYVTGRPESCGSCHATAASLKSWRSGDHAGTSCVACHEGGWFALPASAGYRLGDAVSSVRGVDAVVGLSRPVPSPRCLGCHAEVAKGTLALGAIRVSHRAFLERGYECTRCHAGVGHSKADTPDRAIGMNECIGCHDGKTAASACSTCHIGDPSRAVRLDRAVYVKADIPAPPGCRGCHETKSCTGCHGIEMPHPVGFGTAAGHAKLAAFERKELCWRCHVPQDCRRCHRGDFNAHGGASWKTKHPSGVPLDGRNACACHVTPNFCGLCHATSKR